MKKNLFLLVVGLLSSVMSFAQPEGWNDPSTSLVKTTNIIADGSTVYYLKNEAVQNWFVAGNNWWTQACVVGPEKEMPETSPYGHQVRFSDPDTYAGYYRISDMSPDGLQVKNSWVQLFDNNGTIYSDSGDKDEKTYWKLTFDGDNNFTFVSHLRPNNLVGLVSDDGVNPKVTPDDKARSGSSSTGDYTMNNTGNEVATVWSLWSLGAPEAVAEWNAGCALVARMQEIYEESKEAFDVAPYAEQIGEQKGTIENAERLKSVLAQLNADYLVWKYNNGGKKAVEALTNPGFEDGFTGWKNSGMQTQTNTSFPLKGGTTYVEAWQPNGTKSVSQTVVSMPVGMYKLSADILARGVTSAKLAAAGNELSLPIGEDASHQVMVFSLDKVSDITVKYEGVGTGAGASWLCVDNFSLKYLGSGGDAYANMFDVDYTGKASKQYVDGFARLVDAIRTAEGDEAIQAAYKAAKDYEDGDVADNVAAWVKYEQLCADALVLANDPDFKDFATKLASMVQNKYDIVENDPTTAELNEDYGKIQDEMNNVKSQIKPGTDITKTYLKNADFTQGLASDPTKGWVIEGTKTNGCNWRIKTDAKCGECWNGKDFDFYQIVQDAPVGVYQIEVQGFTRAKRGNDAWNCYFDSKTGELLETPIFGDWTPNKANVYLNDNTGDLSISFAYGHTAEEAFFTKTDTYTDPLGQYIYPDGMDSAGESFAAGEYKVTAFGLVAKQGDALRIGVKGNNYGLDNWAIFTNFKLVYQGFDADIIRPEFQKAVTSLDQAHIGTELQGELKTLQGEAAAVSQSEGKAMFDMLSKIYAFNTKKAASEEVFEELNNQIKNLEDVYQAKKETATDNAIRAALQLQAKAINAYADEETGLPTVTTEAAQKMLEEFDPVIEALKIPKSAGSDDEPADFTDMIKNANMASAEGWTVETGNMATDATNKIGEFFNQEKYNAYQQFTGLPEGLYEVTVQGYYRAGEIAQDWPAVAAGTESNAMLYVINDNKTLVDEDPETPADTINCALRHVSAEAVNENPGFGDLAEIKPFAELGDETVWYMPNRLSSGAKYFESGLYVNTIYFYIWGPDDTVTLGIKKEGPAITNDWTAFSNWKFIGYGNQSEKEPGAQTQSCDPVTPVIGAIKGDVNGDGVVDGADIQEVINTILSGEYVEKADVNKDQVVDGADIQEVINVILGN